MNKRLFLYLYEISENNKIIGKISSVGTKLSYYVFFVIYLLFGVFLAYKSIAFNSFSLDSILSNKAFLVNMSKYIFVPLFTLIINSTLRKLFKVERPFSKLGKKSLIGHKASYSFPSNHAACAMVITVAAIFAMGDFNLLGCFIVFLAFLTGLSRIMSGVHYPADVLAGWFNGLFLGILGFYAISFI